MNQQQRTFKTIGILNNNIVNKLCIILSKYIKNLFGSILFKWENKEVFITTERLYEYISTTKQSFQNLVNFYEVVN